MEVGKRKQKEVSELNNELFTVGWDKLESSADIYGEDKEYAWHVGRYDFGKFIDWLELNYDIKKKV